MWAETDICARKSAVGNLQTPSQTIHISRQGHIITTEIAFKAFRSLVTLDGLQRLGHIWLTGAMIGICGHGLGISEPPN